MNKGRKEGRKKGRENSLLENSLPLDFIIRIIFGILTMNLLLGLHKISQSATNCSSFIGPTGSYELPGRGIVLQPGLIARGCID